MKHSIYVLFMLIGSFMIFSSCSDDEPVVVEDPVASFQFEADPDDFRKVTFSNFSQNFETSLWDFGDGNTSTEESPVHTYAEAGDYQVELTVTSATGATASKTQTVSIVDPLAAQRALIGDNGKTWYLLADNSTGVNTIQVGPENRSEIWFALGSQGNAVQAPCVRSCIMDDTWTFNTDGTFSFENNGDFWAEGGIWPPEMEGTCFDATNAANWVNNEGTDISAWNSGTHNFSYDPSANTLNVSGDGAFIGLSKVTTSGETNVPVSEVTYQVARLVETSTTDTLVLVTDLTDDAGAVFGYWQFTLVSYDETTNPIVVDPCEEAPFGEDLADIAPATMGHTFETAESFDLLGTIAGTSVITPGVADPAGGTTDVGQFDRTADQFQEAQLRVAPDPKDIDFSSMTTVSIDVYLPSSNDYTGGLTKKVIIGLADVSATQEWWTNLIQYESAELATDEWVTVTFQLDNPSFANTTGETPFNRTDLDMVFVQIGGGNHTDAGTFYVRNLSFQ
ncbi:MAG: PKD domain-containing protein [Candidatus Cyclobacteriaceae bacterium M2_1C_046]